MQRRDSLPPTATTPSSKRAAAAQQRAAKERARRRNQIVTVAVAVVLTAVVVTGLVVALRPATPATSAAAGSGVAQGAAADLVVRQDSHKLTSPATSRATLVEFLDFECEACRAAYPTVEQLRQTYGDRVTFVVRYFPLPGHVNAERAARAVEAAAQQGKFEAMYQKMYQTQPQWGEQQTPMDDVFRSFARELGLDMTAWEAAYGAPETLARIKADVADGERLGVTGTPTFFLNGQLLQPRSVDDLTRALDQATAGR